MTSQDIDALPLSPKLALREFGPSFLILLACLFVTEAALRTDALYELLPLPQPYYSFDVTRRVHALELLKRSGPVDVLFLGSSIVRAAFDPRVFDKAARRRGVRVTSFNAGLSAMKAPGNKMYLEHIWLDIAHPRYVLMGVRESELALGSTKSRHLTSALERRWYADTPWSLFEAEILQHIRMTAYQGTLRRMIARTSAGKAWHIAEPGELQADSRGHRRERSVLGVKRLQHNKRLWRYLKGPSPNRYRNSLPLLEQMRQLCADAGATFVLVNMPEHPERYAAKQGRALWQDYQRRVRAWADQHHVPYLDVTNHDLRAFADDRDYSDFHHLSQRGAEHFSTLLAKQFTALAKSRKRKQ